MPIVNNLWNKYKFLADFYYFYFCIQKTFSKLKNYQTTSVHLSKLGFNMGHQQRWLQNLLHVIAHNCIFSPSFTTSFLA